MLRFQGISSTSANLEGSDIDSRIPCWLVIFEGLKAIYYEFAEAADFIQLFCTLFGVFEP
jgi:hypothetical protein